MTPIDSISEELNAYSSFIAPPTPPSSLHESIFSPPTHSWPFPSKVAHGTTIAGEKPDLVYQSTLGPQKPKD